MLTSSHCQDIYTTDNEPLSESILQKVGGVATRLVTRKFTNYENKNNKIVHTFPIGESLESILTSIISAAVPPFTVAGLVRTKLTSSVPESGASAVPVRERLFLKFQYLFYFYMMLHQVSCDHVGYHDVHLCNF